MSFKRDQTLVLIFGILAVGTGLFGYTGLYRKLTQPSDIELRRECYRIIDYAQLWFYKPKMHGGGGRSFEQLAFDMIGLSDEENSLSWKGENGTFLFKNCSRNSFDLEAAGVDGSELHASDISFDTRPVLKER